MIKYTGADIITRAEQIADLTNSYFMSDDEKYKLLNESFTMLYQKVINSGDKQWIAEAELTDGTELPEDFYQLSNIYVESTRERVPKINASSTNGYELRGNNIRLYGAYKNVTVTVEYYPVPPTIDTTAPKEGSEPAEGHIYNLSYPNNLFWIVLSYALAISFKVRQNADTSALSALYSQAENQFFDSLNRDINEDLRIKNVYKQNTWSVYGN